MRGRISEIFEQATQFLTIGGSDEPGGQMRRDQLLTAALSAADAASAGMAAMPRRAVSAFRSRRCTSARGCRRQH